MFQPDWLILSILHQSYGYNLDIMPQSVCLVVNPIMVYSYGFLFNYMTVGQASDSMTALDVELKAVGWCLMLVCSLAHVAQLELFFSSDYL